MIIFDNIHVVIDLFLNLIYNQLEMELVVFLGIIILIIISAMIYDRYFLQFKYYHYETGEPYGDREFYMPKIKFCQKNTKIKLQSNSVWYFALCFALCFSILYLIDKFYFDNFNDFWCNIIMEFHGILLDLVFFGIIFAVYERWKEKKERKDRYLEEILDYKEWKEPEASYRLAGLIRRINKEGVTALQLSDYYLEKADLSELDLTGSIMISTNLKGANLYKTEFRKSFFNEDTALDRARVHREDWFEWLKINEVNGINKLRHLYYIEKYNQSLSEDQIYILKLKGIQEIKYV